MAAGRVCTGFSKPYVAKYAAAGGNVTYSEAQVLARGVNVDISPESSDDNTFYADNVAAEVAAGTFTGGTVTVTVDGLLTAAKRFIGGLPEAMTVNGVSVLAHGDGANPPYVGFGYIARFQSDGVVSYVPTVLTKVRFSIPGMSAATQEEAIDWQTQELTASIMRDDTAAHNWLYEAATDYETEEAAEAALKKILGVSA